MRALNRIASVVVAFCLTGLIAGCLQTSPKVVRIGFVAPFEGRYREIGDQVIPAARYAIREYASRFPENHLVIELAVYDDRGIPELAADQARKLTSDLEVEVVIGHWRDETTRSALPIYTQADIPVITFSASEMAPGADVNNLSPSLDDMRSLADTWNTKQPNQAKLWVDGSDDPLSAAGMTSGVGAPDSFIGGPVWGLHQTYALLAANSQLAAFVSGSALPGDVSDTNWTQSNSADFVAGFKNSSLGAPPGLLSIAAYQATWLAIKRVAEKNNIHGDFGPADNLTFDQSGRRRDAPVYLYRWDAGQPALVARLR